MRGRVAALATVVALLAAGPWGPSAAHEPARAPSQAPAQAPAQRAAAGRLVVPAIGVDARVVPVGTGPDGGLAITGNVAAVFRWRDGVRPGDLGSAVLAGHTWSKGDGVFDRLGEVRRGDRVRVGRHRFTVTSTRVVRRMSAAAVAGLYSDRGPARLVLITCGDRDDTTGVYRTRIIVRARLDARRS